MSKSIIDVQLLDLLPPNMQDNDQVKALSQTIWQAWKPIVQNMEKVFISVETANDTLLDELAWQEHVDFYNSLLPIETKRELIRNSFKFHIKKGTPAIVEELITAIFGNGQVEEWFEYGGEPYFFRIITSNSDVTNKMEQEFLRALNSIKRLSAWLDGIVILIESAPDIYWTILPQTFITQEIEWAATPLSATPSWTIIPQTIFQQEIPQKG